MLRIRGKNTWGLILCLVPFILSAEKGLARPKPSDYGGASTHKGVIINRSVLEALGPAPRPVQMPRFLPPRPLSQPAIRPIEPAIKPRPLIKSRPAVRSKPVVPFLKPSLPHGSKRTLRPSKVVPPLQTAPVAPQPLAPVRKLRKKSSRPAAISKKIVKKAPSVASALPLKIHQQKVSLVYPAGEYSLPQKAYEGQLKNVVTALKGDSSLSLMLKGYSHSVEDGPVFTRQQSLLRALSVRDFFMSQGISATRMDVKAVGSPKTGKLDRVDIELLKRS